MQLTSNQYINDIKHILLSSRPKVYQAVNSTMVEAYWKIGERIVQEEKNRVKDQNEKV
ncbi:DUF1016 N-terminal domain-containing protein [Mannheimia glucosida]|uniref:DUF1016 N-terminal domain-containing protein n=1 Tax=Mannheimia glucosida TaxID=85401 RepID=UPI0039183BB5